MAGAVDVAVRPGGRIGRMRPALLVWALGLTQIIGYGTLYYSFSILAPAMARDFGWSVAWVFGAFSAALLVGGFAAPWAGRLIDRRGAGTVMAWGSGAAALALAGTALAPERTSFVLGLVAIEVASTLVLYDAAFAALVQGTAADAKRNITRLTLIAGFASTLFWPATSTLHEHLGWREVYLVFAALNLVLCLPAHLWIARTLGRTQAGQPAERPTDPRAPDTGALQGRARRTGFALVALGFSLGGFVLSALLVHMLPVLSALGLAGSAALIGMVFGPAQVLGRIANMTFGGSLPPVGLAILSAALLPAAVAILLMSGPSSAAAILFALMFGLGSGLVSIVRGTVPLALFGREGYGERLGQITAVRLVVTSLAPFAFAVAVERFGIHAALAAVAGLGTLGALAFAWTARLPLSSQARACPVASGEQAGRRP